MTIVFILDTNWVGKHKHMGDLNIFVIVTLAPLQGLTFYAP